MATIADLRLVVGNDHVHTLGDETLTRLATRFAVHPGVAVDFQAAIVPGNAEEVRQVVAFAHRAGMAFLTVFGASPIGACLYGEGEGLILDLSRMNRILETDVANGYVRVEPGVTYAQLAAHFASEGLPLWVDSERDPDASIAGSVMAKGIGFTPYGDHALVQCGAEFALPYGELMRTGMGAMPSSTTWQVYKYALGPYADGLSIQSGLMVPTQMGLWVMGEVPAKKLLVLDIADDVALANLVEVLRAPKFANMLPGTISITSSAFDAARHPGDPAGPAWRLVTALYGLPRVVELTDVAVMGLVAGLAGVTSAETARLVPTDTSVRERGALLFGQAGLGAVTFPTLAKGKAASLTFVAPIEDRFAQELIERASAVTTHLGLPLLCEFALVGRALLLHMHLPFDAADPASIEQLAGVARQLTASMQEAGIGLAAQSFELAHLELVHRPDSGLAILEDRIVQALCT
ncbi:MAG: FAD-binding protein [Pseudomonadota bacterium]